MPTHVEGPMPAPVPPGPHALFAIHSLVVPVLLGIALVATAQSHLGQAIPVPFLARMVATRAVVEGVVVAAVSGAAVAWCRTRSADRRLLAMASVLAGLSAGWLQAFLGAYGMAIPMVGHPRNLVVSAGVVCAASSVVALASRGRMVAWRDALLRVGDGISGWWKGFGYGPLADGAKARVTGPVAVFRAYLLAGPLLALVDMLAVELGRIAATPFVVFQVPGTLDPGTVAFLLLAFPCGAYLIGGLSVAICGTCVAMVSSRRPGRSVLVLASVPAALAGDMAANALLPHGIVHVPGTLLTDHAYLSVWASVVLAAYLVRVGRHSAASGRTGPLSPAPSPVPASTLARTTDAGMP